MSQHRPLPNVQAAGVWQLRHAHARQAVRAWMQPTVAKASIHQNPTANGLWWCGRYGGIDKAGVESLGFTLKELKERDVAAVDLSAAGWGWSDLKQAGCVLFCCDCSE